LNCHIKGHEMKMDPGHIDDRFLVLYLLDEISDAGRRDVEAWLEVSEENRDHFDTLKRTWDETGKIGRDSVAFDSGTAWTRLVRRIEADAPGTIPVSGRSGRVRKIFPVRLVSAVAAVLVLGLVSVILVRMLRPPSETPSVILASTIDVVRDTLSDGSSVILNTGTELTVPRKFSRTARYVELKGEAFFQVQPDTTRPFIIQAGKATVKVLGTHFQVSAYPDSLVDVYVESGRVELSLPDKRRGDTLKTILNAGERGRITAGSNRIERPGGIGPDELYWANRKLIFKETRLSVVFDLLKTHYSAVIEVGDPDILNCLLSAVFTDEPVDQILKVVAASFDLTLKTENGKFIITGKGCGHEK
jgi:transmembrane sensor